ncbi:MAG: hypothetical protein M4579_003483 [Chaenotheca gracillima]|nr:MAG: hypothetical protein M4579_003483 [Chaenotheca gracillima]
MPQLHRHGYQPDRGSRRTQPRHSAMNQIRPWTSNQPVLRNEAISALDTNLGIVQTHPKILMTESARPDTVPLLLARDKSAASISDITTAPRKLLSPVNPVLPSGGTWASWDSLSVKIFRGVPVWATTLDLWNAFSQYGSVDAIDIFEDRQGNRDGAARIRFRPPPAEAFWLAGILQLRLRHNARLTTLETCLENNRKDIFIQSPINCNIRYPRFMSLTSQRLDFGIMYDPATMMVMHSTGKVTGSNLCFLEFNLERKRIEVFFDLRLTDSRGDGKTLARPPIKPAGRYVVGGLNRLERYRFRIPFDQLTHIHEVREGSRPIGLVLSLDTPPNFYRKAVGNSLTSSHDQWSSYWNEWDTWYRQTDIVYDPWELKAMRLTLRKAKPIIDIGRWTTYFFAFDEMELGSQNYTTICDALRDHNVKIEPFEDFRVIRDQETAVWQWIDNDEKSTRSQSTALQELSEIDTPHLTFPIRYQLEACISRGFLNEHNLSKRFVERLGRMEERKALNILEWVAQQQKRIFEPMALFDDSKALPSKKRAIPHYCTHMRKVTVTPSMIYFNTPSVEISNRVVRRYVEHSDRFLRVSFTDEQFQGRIHSTEKETNAEIFTRIKRAMTNGISIGDRHYYFLAFGNSQLREHGAYFFAPTSHLNIRSIRDWMGDFQDISIPAKYAARIGQCFSTTRAIKGSSVDVITLKDHDLHLANGRIYRFTDGVGKISKFLAQLISSELKLSFIPSVFQFRMGGCKGVLTVWPDAGQKEVYIRRSQYKFAAVHNGLEVIRWSQYASAALNRQIITVLSTLGVKDEVFVRKLQAMLASLERAMWDETTALSLLQKYIDPNQITLSIAGMILDGFQKSEDPFTRSLLRLWRAWSIKYLKEHAKIVIGDGAFVFGCVDETKTLKGHYEAEANQKNEKDRLVSLPEIFIQIPDPENKGQYKVVEDICILARNPSLHSGDIRLVKAVDQPALRHLRDVVVIPQTGDRDVAGMCSGGDLDGDDYLVIWDKDLRPPEFNLPPMEYFQPEAAGLDRPVADHDITDFFVQYMKNDALGSIAHAHLAHADHSGLGVKDEKCVQLAALHSKAVDYAKTGQPAHLPKSLRPRLYPHFMEKSPDRTYTSRKVLGQLYDQVERVAFVPEYETGFDERILKAWPLDESLLRDARELKKSYDAEMRRIMAQHEIQTEFEVWSTFVLHHSGERNDYKFHEEIGRISSALKDQHREACIARAGGQGFEKLGPFVAAMYVVTCKEVSDAIAEKRQIEALSGENSTRQRLDATSMPLISFPWCFARELGQIASTPHATLTGDKMFEIKSPSDEQDDQHSQKRVPLPTGAADDEDILHTAKGMTHRGEILELFDSEKKEPMKHPQPFLESRYGQQNHRGNTDRALESNTACNETLPGRDPSAGKDMKPAMQLVETGGADTKSFVPADIDIPNSQDAAANPFHQIAQMTYNVPQEELDLIDFSDDFCDVSHETTQVSSRDRGDQLQNPLTPPELIEDITTGRSCPAHASPDSSARSSFIASSGRTCSALDSRQNAEASPTSGSEDLDTLSSVSEEEIVILEPRGISSLEALQNL